MNMTSKAIFIFIDFLNYELLLINLSYSTFKNHCFDYLIRIIE